MSDCIGFVILDTNIRFLNAQSLSQNRNTDQQLLAALQHHAVVRSQIGLALNAIDDQELSLLARRNAQLNVCGEGSTTHTDNTCRLDLCNDLLGLQLALANNIFREVDTLSPLVTLALDGDCGLAQTCTIDRQIDSRNRTRNGCVNVARHETTCLGDQLTRKHLIAFGYLSHCGSTDMLRQEHSHGIGQRQDLDGLLAAQFIL